MGIQLVHSNAVVLKGQGDSINVLLDPLVPFEEIKKQLKNRTVDTKQFFEGASSHISFSGRNLSNEEENELLAIILKETNLEVPPFVSVEPLHFPGEREPHEKVTTVPENVHPTIYHRGVLRSGQYIRYEGSVIVLGDTNPGSEIIADGNIIVLGDLKGTVHAGFKGDESCFVSGSKLWPTQLRIASQRTYIPVDKRQDVPAYAYIYDGQVYVAPLT